MVSAMKLIVKSIFRYGGRDDLRRKVSGACISGIYWDNRACMHRRFPPSLSRSYGG